MQNETRVSQNFYQRPEKENHFQHPAVFQGSDNKKTSQSLNFNQQQPAYALTTQNTRVNSALSQSQQVANKHQTPTVLTHNQNFANNNGSHPFQHSGRNSRFSNAHHNGKNFIEIFIDCLDSSYEEGGKKSGSQSLAMGAGYQNLPSDTDPDHSVISKAPSNKQPLLYVDVNLGPGKSERIVVYEGDTADHLAEKFALSHGLDQSMRVKLTQLLDSQMQGVLEKIEEEQNSIHSDNL
jgi:hypothetical protein